APNDKNNQRRCRHRLGADRRVPAEGVPALRRGALRRWLRRSGHHLCRAGHQPGGGAGARADTGAKLIVPRIAIRRAFYDRKRYPTCSGWWVKSASKPKVLYRSRIVVGEAEYAIWYREPQI